MSHAAASLVTDPRVWAQYWAIVWHAIVSPPMVTVAALTKLAGLAHILGAAPQTEASALPQQADAAAHAVVFTAVEFTGTASHAAASLAADPRCMAQPRFSWSHVKVSSPTVAVAVLTKVAGVVHMLGSAPQTERRRRRSRLPLLTTPSP